MIINGLLAMLVKKPMKVAYILNPSLGFIVLTATMTIIPYLMSNAVLQVVGKINSFDYRNCIGLFILWNSDGINILKWLLSIIQTGAIKLKA